MSRIRSVHPGLFTDEAFASRSPLAMVLFIGLWTECDDNGVFEWKPVTLKMKLLPVHAADCAELLDELSGAGMVRRYEIDGRQLGAVRNFCRYQRPKFPKSQHMMTDDIRSYVGSTRAATEIPPDDPPPIPRNGEIRPQMEEGGGRMKREKKDSHLADGSEHSAARPAPGQPYAFVGSVIRLNSADLEAWRRAFPRYPSLEAELTAIDAKLRDNPPADGKWFGLVAAWLRAKHDKLPEPAKRKDPNAKFVADAPIWDEIRRQKAGR